MKKIFSLMMAIAMMVSILAGCANTDKPAGGGCGGFTVAAQRIAVLCSTVAFVVIKKRK